MSLTIRQRPSPNHGPRRAGPVDILLLHYTGMPSAEQATAWLCNPVSQVSCHYVVDEDGTVTQLVDEDRRAWHAGRSFWQGESDINSRSIGIEIVNPGHEFGYRPFPDVQIAALIELCTDILARHPIPRWRVLAHSDVAPERKEDPGELFPWQRMAEAGIGLWVPPAEIVGDAMLRLGDAGPAVLALKAKLAAVGYATTPGALYDRPLAATVAAFQRHFRPGRVDGEADVSTVETLQKVAAVGRF